MDMRTTIAGVSFQNPVIAASGTFGFGHEFARLYPISRLGGFSISALTLNPREGNPPPRVCETAMGMLNAIGLQNPGVRAYIEDELPQLPGDPLRLIANVAGSAIDDYCETARLLAQTRVHMIELNISCPNVKQGGITFGVDPGATREIVSAVKACCLQKPLIVKLSPNVTDIVAMARAAQESGADALSLINTVSGMAINAQTRRIALGNITGGLSGPAIKPIALRAVYLVTREIPLPVIGMGGIMTGQDAAEFLLAGAQAVMVGTANLADPYASLSILYELETYLQSQGMNSPGELVGALR